MAKYIELAGVPGIGKTTTYNYLEAKFGKQLEFYNSNDKGLTTRGKKFLKEKVLGKVTRLLKPQTVPGFETDHLQKFVDKNHEFNDRFWKALALKENRGKQDLRFVTARYTAKIFAKIYEVTDSNSRKVFIVDEGLIHCINNFIYEVSNQTYEQQVLDVLDMISLPDGVVFFSGDANIAVERTTKRKYKRERDKFLSHNELLEERIKSMVRKQSCMEMLKQKNVPVLYLDAKEDVETKADKIISFVHDLNKL